MQVIYKNDVNNIQYPIADTSSPAILFSSYLINPGNVIFNFPQNHIQSSRNAVQFPKYGEINTHVIYR